MMRHKLAVTTKKLEKRTTLRIWLRHTLLQSCALVGSTALTTAVAVAQFPNTPYPAGPAAQAPAFPNAQPTAFRNAQPTGPQSVAPPAAQGMPMATAGSARLQAYNVPSQFVGQVGAELQIHYHASPDVKVTTDPRTGQLMVLAPDAIHREITAQIDGFMRANGLQAGDRGMNVASTQTSNYSLQYLAWRDLEGALQRLAGPKLSLSTERNDEVSILKVPNSAGLEDVMQIDRTTNQVTLLGSSPSTSAWLQVIHSLDQGQADMANTTHIVPVAPAEPRRVREAIRLVKASTVNAAMQDPLGDAPAEAQAQLPDDDEQVMAMDSLENLGSQSGLFGDVQLEFVDDLGVVIIRGSKRDVQRTLEVIEKIKAQAIETQPEIDVFPLEHANAEAVAALVTQLYADIFEPRQGAVSITALGQPNALLLIGRGEVVNSVKELIAKIDQPLDPANQLKVIRLINASAVDVEARIREFFVDRPGGGDEVRTGLGTRVKVLGDYRTNSLIIQAAPREMVEVERLIEELDVEGATAENEVRIFRLKNTLAADLQAVIQEVITGQPQGGQGGQGNAAQATPLSGRLSIFEVDNGRKKIDSGILAGVVITADPSVNALVVRAPSPSMDLIDQLIKQLDQLPSAEARIKVFQLRNGDAISLAQTMQSLFGLPVTAGQGAGNAFLNNLSQSAITTGGESSLVQLQIAPDARTNSIIVSGAASDLEVFEVLLLRLDEDVVNNRRQEVIWLRNAGADDVAVALQSYFQQQAQIFSFLNNGINQVLSPSQLVNRQVLVVSEPTTNSILISATDEYFRAAIELIERLDRRPPLVCVQVLIAEVQLDDGFELGAEWGLQDGLLFDRGSATGGTLSSPVFGLGTPLTGPSGGIGQTQNVAGQSLTTFGVGRSNATGIGGLVLSASSEAVGVLLRALQTSNRVQVLSRPQITTLDSRQATTLIGGQVPRVSGISQANAVNPQQVVTEDVPFGLQLAILPRVNQDGMILMTVDVVNSTVGDPNSGIPIGFGPNGEVIRSPIINEISANTTVTAYSGQTVVFAGLISKQRTSNRSQVPILGSLPLIGAAFRFDVETEQRRELLVVLTPRIIQTDEDYELIKQVESSRMSWCLADVLNIHGDVGLSGGNGLWGPARSPVIHPDVQPTVLPERTRPYGQAMPGGLMEPMLIDGSYPLGQEGTSGEPSMAPELDISAGVRPPNAPFRQVSFPQPQSAPASNTQVQPNVNRR